MRRFDSSVQFRKEEIDRSERTQVDRSIHRATQNWNLRLPQFSAKASSREINVTTRI